MRIAILGCGAMGTVMGAFMTKGGTPVDMIDNYRAHVDALNERGAICSYAGNANLAASFGKLKVPVNWRYISSPPAEISAHEHLISLARMKVIPFHLFYTEVLPLDRIAEGFDRIFAGESMKTVFTME